MTGPTEDTANLDTDGSVSTEVVDRVLVITIDRPEKKNAMTLAAARAIADALARLDESPELSVGILTGAGGNFCAGMDLKRFQSHGERPYIAGRGFGGVTEGPPVKPLIAAVEGWALGGGFEMVLACDLVVAAQGAQFGLPEVRRGLVARGGGLIRLPQLIPRNLALESMLTGEPLSAARAAELGLVNRVSEPGGALPAALELAALISRNGPMAVAASKSIALSSPSLSVSEAFARQQPLTDAVFASRDATEGALAFTERREPRWSGQ